MPRPFQYPTTVNTSFSGHTLDVTIGAFPKKPWYGMFRCLKLTQTPIRAVVDYEARNTWIDSEFFDSHFPTTLTAPTVHFINEEVSGHVYLTKIRCRHTFMEVLSPWTGQPITLVVYIGNLTNKETPLVLGNDWQDRSERQIFTALKHYTT